MSQSTTNHADGDGLPAPSKRELEAEITQARRELADALDELTTRLSPAHQASQLARGTKQAASDAGGLLSGQGMPDDGTHRARNVKLLLGAVVTGTVVATILVVRAVRH